MARKGDRINNTLANKNYGDGIEGFHLSANTAEFTNINLQSPVSRDQQDIQTSGRSASEVSGLQTIPEWHFD
jgi:hypothetical protein